MKYAYNSGLFIIFFIITFFNSENMNAQQNDGRIRIKSSFFGDDYYIGNIEYSESEIGDIMAADSAASKLFLSARKKSILSYMFMGGSIIGSTILICNSNAVSDTPSSFSVSYIAVAGLSIGLGIISIIFDFNSEKLFRQAIRVYNNNLTMSHYSFSSNGSRFGLSIPIN